jgi:hypothetical protein
MHQQDADATTLEELAAIGKLVFVILVVHIHQTALCVLLFASPGLPSDPSLIFRSARAAGALSFAAGFCNRPTARFVLLRKDNSPLSP